MPRLHRETTLNLLTAFRAVCGFADELMALGQSSRQAHAVEEALALSLVDQFDLARQSLIDSGFSAKASSEILYEFKMGILEAQCPSLYTPF